MLKNKRGRIAPPSLDIKQWIIIRDQHLSDKVSFFWGKMTQLDIIFTQLINITVRLNIYLRTDIPQEPPIGKRATHHRPGSDSWCTTVDTRARTAPSRPGRAQSPRRLVQSGAPPWPSPSSPSLSSGTGPRHLPHRCSIFGRPPAEPARGLLKRTRSGVGGKVS